MIYGIIFISVLPFVLHFSGVDFGNSLGNFDLTTYPALVGSAKIDMHFKHLAGGFTHTILSGVL